MLASIHIENIALIKNIDISFGDGFNVLTGETGAGKSIIIDALSLLCGARSDREIIRSGEDTALVEGIFYEFGISTLSTLAEMDIFPDEDGLLLIQRRLSSDGRTVAKIGQRQVTASKLREIASLLISIHGQQDTQILADEQKQLFLLDGFAQNNSVLQEYITEYKKYTALLDKKQSLESSEEEKSFRLDTINFRLAEIEKAHLSVGEEEKLVSERILLSNSEKIITHTNEVYNNIYRTQKSATERISTALIAIKPLFGIIPEAEKISERLNDVKYELEDIAETIQTYTEQEGGNPIKRLDAVEERLEQINSLKRKYKSDVEGIIKEYERLKEEKESIESASELIEQLEKQINHQLVILGEKAKLLNKSRKEAAEKLINKVEDTLNFLDMPSVRFAIDFKKKDFTQSGNSEVSFLISANVGEVPKPIAKIASGGELSRLMLALKSIPSVNENPVMIFDEIDTGISGKTSEKIGIKLSDTAKNSGCQVICVTHSAQIAARADTHLLISKSESEGRTTTKLTELKGNSRIEEISRIIGGVVITDTVRNTAREMLGL
ncbi:MAG: DNA repair protein RecN [Clostridiales bacterium GWF2_36_10]|nr:MAG: DNA repair protein RecN [Clostridiales bacterium GWF2_36_10]